MRSRIGWKVREDGYDEGAGMIAIVPPARSRRSSVRDGPHELARSGSAPALRRTAQTPTGAPPAPVKPFHDRPWVGRLHGRPTGELDRVTGGQVTAGQVTAARRTP